MSTEHSEQGGEAGDETTRESVVLLDVLVYVVLPPSGLLAGAFAVDQFVGVGFGDVVFYLTLITVGAWILTVGSYQTGSMGGRTGPNLVDHAIVQRASTGTNMAGEARSNAGHEPPALWRYYAADLLTPSSITLVLTVTVIVGWIVVLVFPR